MAYLYYTWTRFPSLSGLILNVSVNNYGHVETVSSPNHTFSCASLTQRLTSYFVHTLSLFTDKNRSWISGWSISAKVWVRAGIELASKTRICSQTRYQLRLRELNLVCTDMPTCTFYYMWIPAQMTPFPFLIISYKEDFLVYTKAPLPSIGIKFRKCANTF